MITLTTEQAQQIEEASARVEQSAEECMGDDGMVMVVPLDLYNELVESLEAIRASRAQEQAEQSSEAATPTTLAEPVAFVSDVYQSRYTLEWNGRSLPVGTLLYDHSLSLAVRQELEHKAEEAECVKLSLDKAGVPTADASGKAYSLWGRVCRYVEQEEQEPTVSDGVCGGCAKKASDGWALYCVECWEKANGEPVDANPPQPNAQVLKPDSNTISGAKQYPVGHFLPQIDESDCDVVHRHRYAGSFGG